MILWVLLVAATIIRHIEKKREKRVKRELEKRIETVSRDFLDYKMTHDPRSILSLNDQIRHLEIQLGKQTEEIKEYKGKYIEAVLFQVKQAEELANLCKTISNLVDELESKRHGVRCAVGGYRGGSIPPPLATGGSPKESE